MDSGGSVLFPKNARNGLAAGDTLTSSWLGCFQAVALTDDVMISPSFPKNAVRGFWPGLGAKSWAFAGIAPSAARQWPRSKFERDRPKSIFGARMANLYASPRFTRSGAA